MTVERALDQAALALRILEAAPHRLGKSLGLYLMRAGGDEKRAALGDERGGEPRQLAIAAQRWAQILFRARESRRVGDHQIEALVLAVQPLELVERIALGEAAARADAVELGRARGEL